MVPGGKPRAARRSHKTPKPSQFRSCRLAGVHDRQEVHHKNPETGYKLVAPSGTEVHRQAVPHGTQKIQYNNMCRLAAMNSPPGGDTSTRPSFWVSAMNRQAARTL
ncbi:hypothetical protein DEO72_LG9g1638 [Vigna unguiculata]|uniref:Uncharacterized protein n=1 Tax=Vigna unguiculata TaxID=3917 RepID=A0A4D6N167_VIGUN|nr:hypothetical protein DEO72_LG9g1638 [Vigna unguiculata]